MAKSNLKDTRLSAQRRRLLKQLQEKGSVTTLEARRHLDIMSPAARIFELRHQDNCNIQLHWVDELTDTSIRHKVGKYTLQSGKWKSNNKSNIEVSND